MRFETGIRFEENEPSMPGHHVNPQTPNHCLCCGDAYYYLGPRCICLHVSRWFQNELRQVACEVHIAEKAKAGLFQT